jgi:HSP20 family molecular chaperone IbpA
MRKKKKFSLFEKLTGSIHMDDFDDEEFFDEDDVAEDGSLYASLEEEVDEEYFDDEEIPVKKTEVTPRESLAQKISKSPRKVTPTPPKPSTSLEVTPEVHMIKNSLPAHNQEVPVDVIETDDTIYIRTEITGVDPDTIDIDLTRDTLILTASKNERRSFGDDEYLSRELYWGDVGRSLDLPDEVEVEEAEAHAEFGVLLITLPKIDKARKTKLVIGKKKKPVVRK